MDAAHISPAAREWAKEAIGRVGKRLDKVQRPNGRRRLLILHLDGVPRPVFDQAVREGHMPFLARLIRGGAYHLDTAFWGSPASTPFFQAGTLYGIRHPDLPAYNWFDRQLGREVRMNQPSDTLAIEGRLASSGRGLLEGGTSYLSLFRGEATNRLCMSALADLKHLSKSLPKLLSGIRDGAKREAWRYLSHVLADVWSTGMDVFRWVDQVQDWRHEREYMLNRLFLVSLAWNLARKRTLIDMVAGVPAIYLVFGNFDEVAHRRGPFSKQSRQVLHRADAAIEELAAVAASVEHPYDLYLVTDHGHVDSAPFEQRRGQRLKRYLLHGPAAPLPGHVIRSLLDGRTANGSPIHLEEDPVVIEAGNFSHVYLSRGRPFDSADLVVRHPDVVFRAMAHQDVAIVAMRRGDSAVALIGQEVYGPRDVDRAPLRSEFSRRALVDLLEELPHMPNAGDLILYGDAVGPTGTVGFSWEFGSHGGLTKIETESLVCWPADAPIDLRGLTHCTQLHQKLSEVYRA